ncbi:hypothetical protein B0H10DRAFT_2214858 [Mycena sp. CBHHK59/15]|nr:hypothetical protein B0H10DRAFT_2214858 [Mycena sp. CBHHK59/15]
MSRFLWFFVGAGVGAWWATNKKMRFDCHVSRTLPAPPISSAAGQQMAPPNMTEVPNYPPIRNHDWEQERARIRELSQSAGDTVAELSEATLNTIIQATEVLKAKMAERRVLWEEERKVEEERRRNPPRYV